MDYKEFQILAALEATENNPLTQRQLADATDMSVGTINATVATIADKGWMDNGTLTVSGLTALEPYRVKRAVFYRSRIWQQIGPYHPQRPKSLVRVRGKRIIDSLLDAVTAMGIEEAYIVRGYYGEQFDALKYKYPNITFIENPMHNEANNIELDGSTIPSAELLHNRIRLAFV